MTRHHHWSVVFASVFALACVDAALANPKHRHGVARYRAGAPVAVGPTSSFEPARMIEIRPGLVISSYDCVTDDGYGRFRPCSAGTKR